jgi:hypothetical protein
MLLGGAAGHNTQIITAYYPCRNKNINSGTSYQQQRWYFVTKKKDLTCPLILFCKHLIKELKQWQVMGDRIVLFMDYNEQVTDGKLGQALGDREGPGLVEAALSHTGTSPGATLFWGLHPIDGLWVSKDLDISNVCVMPFGFGVGNHRAFIIDISLELLVGVNLIKVIRPASRQLNSRILGCAKAYIASLESNIKRHKLLKRLHDAHTGGYTQRETARRVIAINEEGKQYMSHAEKICRKIKCCRIPFSPEASIWICRVQVYYSLLCYHHGKIKNWGNLKRAARRCNIPNPLSLLVQDILTRLKECKFECIFYQEHGQRFHWKHLNDRLKVAQEQEDEEAFAKISAIIQREQQRAFWRKLNFVTGKKSTRSATTIQCDGLGGAIMEYCTRDMVERTIFSDVHKKRYTLAGEAPICNGAFLKDFRYMATTPASCAVLDSTYVPPPGSDAATADLFREVAEIQKLVLANSVSFVITPEQWKQYWQVVNEKTSSSASGIHFGHYIVGCNSEMISHYHAAHVTVTLAHAIQLERWSKGLSVMLEKTLGVTLVTKLCAILLMEGDFNATNKIMYRGRMLNKTRKHALMPEDIFSKKNHMADDGTLCKTLFYDITRQAHIPAVIASVDALNCYDRIVHAMASLIFQAFGVPPSAVKSMMGAIDNMKFFLRTGFGDSTSFAGGGVSIKT